MHTDQCHSKAVTKGIRASRSQVASCNTYRAETRGDAGSLVCVRQRGEGGLHLVVTPSREHRDHICIHTNNRSDRDESVCNTQIEWRPQASKQARLLGSKTTQSTRLNMIFDNGNRSLEKNTKSVHVIRLHTTHAHARTHLYTPNAGMSCTHLAACCV